MLTRSWVRTSWGERPTDEDSELRRGSRDEGLPVPRDPLPDEGVSSWRRSSIDQVVRPTSMEPAGWPQNAGAIQTRQDNRSELLRCEYPIEQSVVDRWHSQGIGGEDRQDDDHGDRQ